MNKILHLSGGLVININLFFQWRETVRNVSENANEKQSTEKRGNNKSNKLTYADIVKGKRNNKKDNEWAMTIMLINYY